MNKASGGDGIPVELFQILKDDAVKVLHSICQQIWYSKIFVVGLFIITKINSLDVHPKGTGGINLHKISF